MIREEISGLSAGKHFQFDINAKTILLFNDLFAAVVKIHPFCRGYISPSLQHFCLVGKLFYQARHIDTA